MGEVQVDGEDCHFGPRDRTVLEALAVRPGDVLSLEDLAGALWGDTPPPSSVKVLQGAVLRLRRRLGQQAVIWSGTGYRLNADVVTTDVVEFEELVTRARALAATNEPARSLVVYDDALVLWRGEPFPDLAQWPPGRGETIRLTRVRSAATVQRLDAALTCGRVTEVAARAQHLLQDDPYDEHLWHLLTSALYGMGRQTDALDTLRKARRLMREELGLEVTPILSDLEEAILRQDATLPKARTVSASGVCPYPGLSAFQPEEADQFVGREDDMQVCRDKLSRHALLTVVGPSGCGKSSLVRAGIVPALRAHGSDVIVTTPGPDPLGAIRDAREHAPAGVALVVDQLEEISAAALDPAARAAYLDEIAAWAATGPVVLTLRADHTGSLALSAALATEVEGGLHLLAAPSEQALRRIIEEPAARSGLVIEAGLTDLLLRDVAGQPGALPLLAHALRETWQVRHGDVLTVDGYLATGGISGAVARTADRLFEDLTGDQQRLVRGLMLRLVIPSPGGTPVSTRLPAATVTAQRDLEPVVRRLIAARLVTMDETSVAVTHESLGLAWPRLRAWLDEDVDGQRIQHHLQIAAEGWDAGGRADAELYRGARLHLTVDWRERTNPMLGPAEDAFLAASVTAEEVEVRAQRLALAAQRTRNRRLRRSLAAVAALLVVVAVAALVAGRSLVRANTADRETTAARLGAAAAVQPRADTALLLARQAVALADTPQTSADLLVAVDTQRNLRSARDGHVGGYIGAQVFVSPATGTLLSLQLDGIHLVDPSTGRRLPTYGPVIPDDRIGDLYAAGFLADRDTAVIVRATSDDGPCRVEYLSAESGLGARPTAALPGSRCGDFRTMDRPRISADGQWLVSMSEGAVRVWRHVGGLWTGPRSLKVPGLPGGLPIPLDITFDHSGRHAVLVIQLSGAPPWYRYTNLVVELDTESVTYAAPNLVDPDVACAAISPDGKWVVLGRYDGSAHLVHFGVDPARTPARTVVTGMSPVRAVTFAGAGGSLALGRLDGSLDLVTVSGDGLVTPPRTFRGHGNGVHTIGFTGGRGAGGEELLFSIDDSGLTVVRDLGRSGPLGALRSIERPHAVAVGARGSPIAVGLDDGRIRLLANRDLRDDGTVLSLGPYPSPDPTQNPPAHRRVTALAVPPDGRSLIAGDRLGHLGRWELPSRRLRWSRDDVPAAFLAVSPDGRYLATAEFTQDATDPAPDSHPTSSRVRLWDLADGRVLADVPTKDLKPRAVAFAPDGSTLFVGFFDDAAMVLAVPDGHVVAQLQQAVSSAAYDPSGRTVVALGFDGSASVIDTGTWKISQRFPAPADYTHLAFSGDGAFLFVSTGVGTQVWDAHTLRPLVPHVSLHGDGTNDALFLAVASASDELVLASQTQITRLDLRQATWEAAACAVAGRELTPDEWNRFLPDRPREPACG